MFVKCSTLCLRFFFNYIKGASKNDSHFFLTLTFPLAVLNAHCPVPIGLPLVPPGLRLVCAWSITLSLHWSAPGLRLVCAWSITLSLHWSAPGLRLVCAWSITLSLHWSALGLRLVCAWSAPGLSLVYKLVFAFLFILNACIAVFLILVYAWFMLGFHLNPQFAEMV